jgi:hypothetical protein
MQLFSSEKGSVWRVNSTAWLTFEIQKMKEEDMVNTHGVHPGVDQTKPGRNMSTHMAQLG